MTIDLLHNLLYECNRAGTEQPNGVKVALSKRFADRGDTKYSFVSLNPTLFRSCTDYQGVGMQ